MLVEMNKFFLTKEQTGDKYLALLAVGFLDNVLDSRGCWGWLKPSLLLLTICVFAVT